MRTFAPTAAHEDDRGTITDLIDARVDAVTRIFTKAGAVRGNHFHKLTLQWAYIVTGRMLITTGEQEVIVGPGEMVLNDLGEPHAWRALEDTDCIVCARGPRAGQNYESDTFRLDEPLLT